MVRKSPDKQWNRQNSILFHETIPLNKLVWCAVLKGTLKKHLLRNIISKFMNMKMMLSHFKGHYVLASTC
jgi:hypothetical protein